MLIVVNSSEDSFQKRINILQNLIPALHAEIPLKILGGGEGERERERKIKISRGKTHHFAPSQEFSKYFLL